MGKNSQLRLAVFGTGYWSTMQIPAWLETGEIELAAAYNRTVTKGEAVATRFGIPRVYADPEELIRCERPDVMDIITEVPAHAPLVLLAARYKIPVICQKPMGQDLAQCTRMVQACREAGIPFFIHENFRWQPPLRAVKAALDSGRIGTPFRALIQLGTGGAASFEKQPFLKTLPHCALTDMGSHVFDLARFYFGDPSSVYCRTFRTSADLAGEDVFCAMLQIGDLICDCVISERLSSRVFVEGLRGSIELTLANQLRISAPTGTEVSDCTGWPRHAWVSPEDEALHGGDCVHSIAACNRHLLESLKAGREAETSGLDNLKTAAVMFAAIESAESGQAGEIRYPAS